MKNLLSLILLASSSLAFATPYNLKEFSVFSKIDINYARSDFEGRVGAAGSILVEDFAFVEAPLMGVLAGKEYVHFRGTISSTPVEVGESIKLSHVGANSALTSTQINLDYTSVDTARATKVYVTNKPNGYPTAGVSRLRRMSEREAESWSLNLQSNLIHTSYALDELSSRCREFSGLTTQVSEGKLVLDGNQLGAFNVADFSQVSKVEFTNAHSDKTIIINVSGKDIAFDRIEIALNGVKPAMIIWNFYEATKMSLSYSGTGEELNGRAIGIPGTVIAPLADTTFVDAVITGRLLVNNLNGNILGLSGGQVNFDRHLGNWCTKVKPGKY